MGFIVVDYNELVNTDYIVSAKEINHGPYSKEPSFVEFNDINGIRHKYRGDLYSFKALIEEVSNG